MAEDNVNILINNKDLADYFEQVISELETWLKIKKIGEKQPLVKLTANYLLTEDIDLSGIIWGVSPVPFLDGSFDGNGHITSNLTIADAGIENEYLGFILD